MKLNAISEIFAVGDKSRLHYLTKLTVLRHTFLVCLFDICFRLESMHAHDFFIFAKPAQELKLK